MTKSMRWMFGSLAVVALLGLVFVGVAQAMAEKVTVKGTVTVTEDDDFNVTGVSLKTAEGKVYHVTLDEKGKKMGIELDGAKVEATGTVVEKGDHLWLTVVSYKEVVEDEVEIE